MPKNYIIGFGGRNSKVEAVLAESRIVDDEEDTIQEASRITNNQQADAEAVEIRPPSQTGTPARKLSLYELRDYRGDLAIELDEVQNQLKLLTSLKANRRDNALVKKVEKQVKKLQNDIEYVDDEIEILSEN